MKQDEKELILEKLKEYPVITTACKKTGVSRQTLYRWCSENKAFKKAVKAAIREGILLINDVAEENLIDMVNEKQLPAMKYWLTHHHEDYSRNGFIPVFYDPRKK